MGVAAKAPPAPRATTVLAVVSMVIDAVRHPCPDVAADPDSLYHHLAQDPYVNTSLPMDLRHLQKRLRHIEDMDEDFRKKVYADDDPSAIRAEQSAHLVRGIKTIITDKRLRNEIFFQDDADTLATLADDESTGTEELLQNNTAIMAAFHNIETYYRIAGLKQEIRKLNKKVAKLTRQFARNSGADVQPGRKRSRRS